VADERRKAFRFWADGYAQLHALHETVETSGLEASLLELIKLRASQVNRCAYCIDRHSKDARVRGETEQRLYALTAWRETKFFTDRERAALALTEAVTQVADNHAVLDSVVAEASAHFDRDEMSQLLYAIIAINAFNRLSITIGAPEPGSYEPPSG
jgi:AhpD family alkylhydroperoxidase